MESIKVKLTPNDIGERAQGVILSEVMKYGYTVLILFGEGRRYDMVIEREAQFFRLQLKALEWNLQQTIKRKVFVGRRIMRCRHLRHRSNRAKLA